MAALVTSLGNTLNTTSGTHTVTATPAVNDLIIIIVANTGSVSSNPPTDNNADGLGTYSTVVSTVKNTSADTMRIFVRNALIGSATSTVFSHAAGTTTGGGLVVLKVTGMTNAGLAAIRQSAKQKNQASGGTPTPVFPVAVNTLNPVIGAVLNETTTAATMTPRGTPAYTEVIDTGYSVPTTGLEVMTINSGETASSIAWGSTSSSAFCSLVVELALNAPPTTALNTPADTATNQSTTPTLNLTGTDTNSDTMEYQVQVDTVNTFDSQGSGMTRVMQTSNTSAAATVTATFGSAPTQNNLLIATVYSSDSLSTVDVPGFTLAVGIDDSTAHSASIWYKLAGASEPTAVVANSDLSGSMHLVIAEYSGNVLLDILDQVASGTSAAAAVNSLSTGTTPATLLAKELLIAMAGIAGTAATPTYTNSFTNVLSTSRNQTAERFVTATGAYSTTIGYTGTAALMNAILATFKSSKPLIDARSATDAGFTAGHPFASGVAKDYTVQSALSSATTYFWRVRAIDPTGSNTNGAWSSIRSFTTQSATSTSTTTTTSTSTTTTSTSTSTTTTSTSTSSSTTTTSTSTTTTSTSTSTTTTSTSTSTTTTSTSSSTSTTTTSTSTSTTTTSTSTSSSTTTTSTSTSTTTTSTSTSTTTTSTSTSSTTTSTSTSTTTTLPASLTDNLVSYYKFDEASGTTVGDSVNTNTGTTHGSNAWTPNGIVNSGGLFDGSTNFTTVADNSTLDFTTNGMSISAWIFPTVASMGGFGGEIVKKDNQYILRIENTSIVFITWAGSSQIKLILGSFNQNAWNHIVAVYNGNLNPSLTIYQNNTVIGTANTQSGNMATSTNQLSIGDAPNQGEAFTGRIDEVGIWSRGLSASDVSKLYNSGAGLQYPFPAATTTSTTTTTSTSTTTTSTSTSTSTTTTSTSTTTTSTSTSTSTTSTSSSTTTTSTSTSTTKTTTSTTTSTTTTSTSSSTTTTSTSSSTTTTSTSSSTSTTTTSTSTSTTTTSTSSSTTTTSTSTSTSTTTTSTSTSTTTTSTSTSSTTTSTSTSTTKTTTSTSSSTTTTSTSTSTTTTSTSSSTTTTSTSTTTTLTPLLFYGLEFDGLQNYVEVSNSSLFSVPTTGELTISFWMEPLVLDFPTTIASADGPYINFLGKGDFLAPTQFEYEFRMYNLTGGTRPNRISFYIFNQSGGIGVGSFFQDTITAGQRIHVVGKIDANNTYIYKNGVLRDSDLYSDIIVPKHGIAPLRFGTVALGDPSFLEGILDDIRIFNRALSDTEVKALFNGQNPATGLIGWWKFDEGQGASAFDSSVNTNTAVLKGSPLPLWVAGIATTTSTTTTSTSSTTSSSTSTSTSTSTTLTMPFSFSVIDSDTRLNVEINGVDKTIEIEHGDIKIT